MLLEQDPQQDLAQDIPRRPGNPNFTKVLL
jgi:hypothetical protein